MIEIYVDEAGLGRTGEKEYFARLLYTSSWHSQNLSVIVFEVGVRGTQVFTAEKNGGY
jgi:hypothetical protein